MQFREPLDRLRNCSHSEVKGIAAAIGVPFPTLRAIRYGATNDPRLSTLEALAGYFKRNRKAGRVAE